VIRKKSFITLGIWYTDATSFNWTQVREKGEKDRRERERNVRENESGTGGKGREKEKYLK